jgi:hypothetical protein
MSDRRYPLSWPAAKPRTPAHRRKPAAFRDAKRQVGVPTAINRLQIELDAIGASGVILSTNLELRLDGRPRGDRAAPFDPGAALYFTLKGREIALACDRWDRVADNIVAIAKHIEALRGQDRWGVGTIEQAFAGYEALPAPEQWWQVLGVRPDYIEHQLAHARAEYERRRVQRTSTCCNLACRCSNIDLANRTDISSDS